MDQLRLLIKKGVKEEELNDAKNRLRDQAIYARDSLVGPAMIIGNGLATGQKLDDIEYWPYGIGDVSAEDVQNVANDYLNPDVPYEHPPVTGYLLPQSAEATVEEESE